MNSSTKLCWKCGGGESPCKIKSSLRVIAAMSHPLGSWGLWALPFLGHVLHSSTSLWFWGKCLKLSCQNADLGSDPTWLWGPGSTVPGSHFRVFGSFMRTLISQWAASRSWAGKDFIQSYQNRSLGSPDLLLFQQGLRKIAGHEGFMTKICWCNRFYLLEYTYVWFPSSP